MVRSGNDSTILSIGTDYISSTKFKARASNMMIYGNVQKFNTYGNTEKITEINLINNNYLKELNCGLNSLNYLDISNCSLLNRLDCPYNSISRITIKN